MKHVLVLNQFALPRTEGGGTRHLDLFGRLKDWRPLIVAGCRNHYTQLRVETDDRRFHLLWVPPHRGGAIARMLGWLIYAVQAFIRAVQTASPDLIYGSSPQPFAALAGLAAARVRRIPFVLEVRDLWPESMLAAGKLRAGGPAHRVFAWIERILVSRADRIVCVTSGWEEHFAALGAESGKVEVIPNGADPADFQSGVEREVLRSRYQIDGFTAIFAGAHGEKDGIDLILDAAQVSGGISFVLVGDGPAKRRAVTRVLEQKITNVSFRDPVPKSQLGDLLRACDVGIHAVAPLTVFEQGMSPNKLFDYLAARLPVVSNAAGPLRRIMRDGECGRVGGPSSLAECLEAVRSASPAERESWSDRGQQLLQQRFSRSTAARQLEQLLEDVLQQHRPRTRD